MGAICEAVSRPQMRFVPVKSAAQQAACGVHKIRGLLVKQRTMLINTLRGLMAEYGVIAGRGPQHVAALAAVLNDPADDRIPEPRRAALGQLVRQFERLQVEIECLERAIVRQARANPICRRLATIPGYGPIVASAMAAIVINPGGFASARHFAAARGPCSSQGQALTPRPSGTGGKVQLGPISKRGNRDLRRLLVNGAMAARRSNWGKADPWLRRLVAEKKRLVAACARANKMARIGWAVMVRQENFRATAAA